MRTDEIFFVKDICAEKFMILGMDVKTIIALQEEYHKRNGKMPMTPETVRELFK